MATKKEAKAKKEAKDRKIAIFRITAHEAALMAGYEYDGPVTEEVIRSAQKAEDAWSKVKLKLMQRQAGVSDDD